MKSSRRQDIKKVVRFNGMDRAIANACVHGVLVVSHMKKGHNSSYFERITDGVSSICFVGFHKEQQKMLRLNKWCD